MSITSRPFAPSLNTSTSSVGSTSQDSENPKKKRKSNVRACDACAIRKVKCDAQRPCHHCEANNLKCTQFRERKKSGPKNLHKKTLQSINTFNENFVPVPSVLSGDVHPIEPVPENLPFPIDEPLAKSSSPQAVSKFTTNNLIENLKLMEDPTIRSSLQKLSINSILNNYTKFIEFIYLNLNNFSIDLLLNSNDLAYLSNLMIIFSLNLIVIENLIKMNTVKLKKFTLKNPSYYKKFKNLLMNKMADLAGTIDKMFLLNNPSVQLDQIFYNVSAGSLNMYAFNSLLPEQYNHQKLLYLRKAITYYQLIRLDKDSKLPVHQVYDLYRSIYANERICYLMSNDNRLFSFFVVNDWNQGELNNKEPNLFFEIAKLLETDGGARGNNLALTLSPNLVYLNTHNTLFHNPGKDLYIQFTELKVNLVNLIKEKDIFNSTVIQVLVFKVLVVYSDHLAHNHLITELISLVDNLNLLLHTITPELLFNFSTFQILPHLFQILKVNLDFGNDQKFYNILVTFTSKLIKLSPTNPYFDKLIKQYNVRKWFDRCEKEDRTEASPEDHSRVALAALTGAAQVSIQTSSAAPATSNAQQAAVLNALDNHTLGAGAASMLSAEAVGLPPDIATQLQHEQLMNKAESTMINNSKKDNGFEGFLEDFSNSKLSSNSSTSNNTNNGTPELELMMKDKSSNFNTTNSYSTLIQYQAAPVSAPVPPVMTAAVAMNNPKPENELNFSESTRNLYSLFNQISDDFGRSQNNSLTNLFQFNNNNSGSNLAKLGSSSNLLKIESSNGLAKFASFGNLTRLRSSSNFLGGLQNVNSNSSLNLANIDRNKVIESKEELKKHFLL